MREPGATVRTVVRAPPEPNEVDVNWNAVCESDGARKLFETEPRRPITLFTAYRAATLPATASPASE